MVPARSILLVMLLAACGRLTGSGEVGATSAGPDAGDAHDATTAVDGSDASDPLSVGLLAYWSFDEPSGAFVLDGSGNGHDGVFSTGGVSRVAGRLGAGALHFDGATGYVHVPEDATLATSEKLTIAFWVKASASSLTMQGRLVTHHDGWHVKLNADQVQFEAGSPFAITDTHLSPDEWHHIAISFDKGVLRFYVDGVDSAHTTDSFDGAQTLAPSTRGVFLGTNTESDGFFLGDLDEVRLYSRVLTIREVAQLAQR